MLRADRDQNVTILNLVGFLALATIIQITTFELFFADSTNDTILSRVKTTSINELQMQTTRIRGHGDMSIASDSFVSNSDTHPTSIRPLDEILAKAGVETNELNETLPTVEGIIDMYGSEPVIVGMDRCETFQNSIIKGDGFVGPAGMFNTVSAQDINIPARNSIDIHL